MDSRCLRAFVTVVDLGGISVAAESLGYAQSTVSAQLRRLEAELGINVLHRTNTGTTVTEAGRELLPYARKALELDDRIRQVARQIRPRLNIGAQEALAAEWLPDILAALDQQTAGHGASADVTLLIDHRTCLMAELAAGRLDLVFLYENGDRAKGPCAVVGHDRAVLVAGPQHPLAQVPDLGHDTLLEADFLVAGPGSTSQTLVDRFRQGRAPHPRSDTVTGSLATLRRLAACGRGIALLPHLAVVRELEHGDLVELDVREVLKPVGIQARWRTGLGPEKKTLHAVLHLAHRHRPSRSHRITNSGPFTHTA